MKCVHPERIGLPPPMNQVNSNATEGVTHPWPRPLLSFLLSPAASNQKRNKTNPNGSTHRPPSSDTAHAERSAITWPWRHRLIDRPPSVTATWKHTELGNVSPAPIAANSLPFPLKFPFNYPSIIPRLSLASLQFASIRLGNARHEIHRCGYGRRLHQ